MAGADGGIGGGGCRGVDNDVFDLSRTIVVVGVAGSVHWLEKNTRFQEPTPFRCLRCGGPWDRNCGLL